MAEITNCMQKQNINPFVIMYSVANNTVYSLSKNIVTKRTNLTINYAYNLYTLYDKKYKHDKVSLT